MANLKGGSFDKQKKDITLIAQRFTHLLYLKREMSIVALLLSLLLKRD
jgi:hypothetical protein